MVYFVGKGYVWCVIGIVQEIDCGWVVEDFWVEVGQFSVDQYDVVFFYGCFVDLYVVGYGVVYVDDGIGM